MKFLALVLVVLCAFVALSSAARCADKSEHCPKLKKFCNDFKYEEMLAVQCAVTCGKC